MSTQSKPTMKRSLRGLIWFGALACFLGGFSILRPPMEAPPASTSSAVALASSGALSAQECGYGEDPSGAELDPYCDVLPDTIPARQSASECGNLAECVEVSDYYSNPLDLLPAWRWGTAVFGLDNTYGAGDVANMNAAMDMLGRLLFALSGILWVVLLGLARLAMLLSPLASDSVGEVVNRTFSAVGSGVSRGLIWIPIVGALLFALIGPIRSKGAASTSSLIILLAVPLGMMWGMMTAVDVKTTREVIPGSKDPADPSGKTPLYETTSVSGVGVGSPVWMARTGTGMIDGLSSLVVSGIGDAFIKERLSPLTSYNGQATQPSCAAYIDGMRGAFERSWNNSSMKTADTGAGTMQTFSDLWMSTMATNWVRAQFGGGTFRGVQPGSSINNVPIIPKGVSTGQTSYGWSMWCHMLENVNGSSIAAQARIGAAAGYPYSKAQDIVLAPNSNSDAAAAKLCFKESQDADASEPGTPVGTACKGRVYGGYLASSEWSSGGGLDSVQDRQQQMMNWAACKYVGTSEPGNSGGWILDPEWNAATGDGVGKGNAYCSFWWNEITPANWKLNGQDFQWDNDGGAIPCVSDGTCNIKTMYRALHGKNAGERLFAGLMALITSLLYFWLLGLLLVGVAISKIGLMVMLVFLPFTLFLLALPKWRVDPKRAQRNAMGLKLLKQTFAFATSTATLQLLVAFLLITIGLIRTILAPFNLFGFTELLAPIAAFIIMQKLTKALGLGNLATPSGAMSLPLAAAAGMGGFGLGGNKPGLASAKAAAKKGSTAKDDAKSAGQKGMMKAKSLMDGTAGGKAGMAARALGAGKLFGKGEDNSIEALTAKAAAGHAAVAGAKTPEERAKAMEGLLAAQSALSDKKAIEDAKEAHKNKKALDAATAADRKAELGAAMTDAYNAELAASGDVAKANAASSAAFNAKAAEHRGLDRANELGGALSAASGGAISAADAAEAIASGAMAGYVTLGDGTSMSIGDAVKSGHAQLDSSGGGAMLTAKGIAAGGSMVGMVNMPGGSSMSMADAVTNGLVNVDAATGAVSVSAGGTAAGLTAAMLPSASMVVAGGSGTPDASALETQTMTYDAVMGSAAGARGTANGTAVALGIGAGEVSPLRGNAGIIAPAHGSATGFGAMQDLGAIKGDALLASTASTALLLGSDTTDQLWAACGGDEETYAAACDNALSMAGIRGMSMGAAISGAGLHNSKRNQFLNKLGSGNAAAVETALSEVRSMNGGQGLYAVSSAGINAAVATAFAQTSSARQNDVGMIHGGVVAMSSDATNAIGEAAEIFDGYTSGSGLWHDYDSGTPAQKSAAEKMIVGRMVNAEIAVMRTQHAHQAAEQLAATGFIGPDNTSWDDERARLVDHYSDTLRAGGSIISDTNWINNSISSMRDQVRDAQVMPTIRPSRPVGVPSSRGVATTPTP